MSLSIKHPLEEVWASLGELLRERAGNLGGWYPLSHAQEALWFLWRLAPQRGTYNLALAAEARSDLDPATLLRSLQQLCDRHACLRTEFSDEGGTRRQRSLPRCRAHLEHVEASGWSREQIDDALHERARLPFDLESDATPRVTLFSRGRDGDILLIVLHRIVADSRSLPALAEELGELYRAEKAGTAGHLPPLRASYEDYARRQRRSLEAEDGERLWAYWRMVLAGDLPTLDLPLDHPRPSLQSFRGDTVNRRLDGETADGLRRLAESEGVSLFVVLLAAFKVLLYRYTGQSDIIVGIHTPRRRAGFEGLAGRFDNLLPIRAELSGRLSFRQLLGQVRERVEGAVTHQEYPFSLIVSRLQPARDFSRSPIFQTFFSLRPFHRPADPSAAVPDGDEGAPITFGDLVLKPLRLARQDVLFDLDLEVEEDGAGGLNAVWKYAADLFESASIRRIAGRFESLVREIAADHGRRIAELHLLTAEESREAVASGRGAIVALPDAASVCELFESQAERRGAAVAVSCGEDSLTYAELQQRVASFAHRLGGLGVGPDVLVGLLLPRGLDFVTMLLSVSKAGGAFLPLDPRHPLSRTLEILERSGAPLLVTSDQLRDEVVEAVGGLPPQQRPRVVTIADLAAALAGARLPPVFNRGLAYVLFTSGSTGRPKGVMVEHAGMVNHVLAKLSDLSMDARDSLAQNGPQSFDIVVWQCLAPLVVGGRAVVFPDEIAEAPAHLLAEVEKRGVTILQLVPSMLHAILEQVKARGDDRPALSTLRWVVPTGDALPAELCRRWFAYYPHIPVLNTYGSTECSDDQCHYALARLAPSDASLPVTSIGRPIHNIAAHVLDDDLAPVPASVVGDLYIGGVGVGRGYLRDPARTAETFIPDPLSGSPGARLYRTRDLARRRADGNLDFLGRVDDMIKLRGFRVEPKEIEAALCRHPAVSEAAVLALRQPSKESQLVAYLVPSSGLPGGPGRQPIVEDIRRFLTNCLPHYMTPAVLLFVDALPLNANGKLDLRRLPRPKWQVTSAERHVPPRTPAEEKMAGIWAEVLGRGRVGVTDDFFALGGDSILCIQVAARGRDAGFHLSPDDIFLHRTIAALAALHGGDVALPRGGGNQ